MGDDLLLNRNRYCCTLELFSMCLLFGVETKPAADGSNRTVYLRNQARKQDSASEGTNSCPPPYMCIHMYIVGRRKNTLLLRLSRCLFWIHRRLVPRPDIPAGARKMDWRHRARFQGGVSQTDEQGNPPPSSRTIAQAVGFVCLCSCVRSLVRVFAQLATHEEGVLLILVLLPLIEQRDTP